MDSLEVGSSLGCVFLGAFLICEREGADGTRVADTESFFTVRESLERGLKASGLQKGRSTGTSRQVGEVRLIVMTVIIANEVSVMIRLSLRNNRIAEGFLNDRLLAISLIIG
jgi:hypothetical protein